MKASIPALVALVFAGTVCPAQERSGEFNGSLNNGFDSNCTGAACSDRAVFTNEIGYGLIRHMPDRTKPVTVTTIGGRRDQEVGDRVATFLSDHGYQIKERREPSGPLAAPSVLRDGQRRWI